MWEFFDRYGEVLQRYDYDKKALQYDRSMQSLDNIGAGFIGGDYHLQEELYGNFDFNGLMNSINSKLGMESGRLVLRFAVDANGGISQITEVENSIKNKKITARAFESLEKLNNKWHPQIINGSPQTTYKTISFDLGVKTENSSFMNDKWAFSNVSKGFNFVIKIED